MSSSKRIDPVKGFCAQRKGRRSQHLPFARGAAKRFALVFFFKYLLLTDPSEPSAVCSIFCGTKLNSPRIPPRCFFPALYNYCHFSPLFSIPYLQVLLFLLVSIKYVGQALFHSAKFTPVVSSGSFPYVVQLYSP